MTSRSFLRAVIGPSLGYGNRLGGGLSKTARSCRHWGRRPRSGVRHLDAVGHADRPMTAAVARRRLPDELPERPAEGPEAGEADVEADVGDAAVGLPQQEHRALYPPPLQVAVRRLAEHGAEATAEVRR